jgi:environmental stress-induced protein Ves
MRILTPAASRRVPWKNGLGATLEIATDAPEPGGEWTWRLSIADVPSRAEFSIFPGVDRFIACLAGPGLELERAGARSLVPREGQALSFAGEEPVTGEPLGPGVRDANLMLRRDRWRGRMTLVRGRGLKLDAKLILVHAPENCPSLRARTAEGGCEIAPGGTLVASGPVALFGASGSVGIACELAAASAAPFRS